MAYTQYSAESCVRQGNDLELFIEEQMGKSSWNTLAADVKKTKKGDDSNKTIPSPACSMDPLLMLDSHRRINSSAKSHNSDVKRGPLPQDASESRRSQGISEHIGKGLRELYGDMLAQPVPDRFLELLNRLEASTISPAPKAKRPGGG
jgi:hypothetical protein